LDRNKLASLFPLGPDFVIKKLLGRGSYGIVVLAEHVPSGKKVAIKKLQEIFECAADAKRITREILLQRLMSTHPNITALQDIIMLENPKDFSTLFLVMEYVESDLHRVFRSPFYLTERHV